MKAIFDHSNDESATIRTFWFKPERKMQYTAGQYTELTLQHDNPDDRGVKRWFTLSSSPNDELVSISTRFAGDKSSTFKKHLFTVLKPGDEVQLEDAMGDFVLPKLTETPVVLVAGGIGITPMHSMLKWIAETHEKRNVRLLWSVRTEDDIIFQDVINASGVPTTINVSEPSPAWGGQRGQLSAELILGLEPVNDDTLVYLSGPEPMLEALEQDLAKHDIQKRQLVTDFFPGYDRL
jgi:ferredoxin-NADP reductase